MVNSQQTRTASLSRAGKYVSIVSLLIIDLILIFITFSGYIDRRRFEEILKADRSGATYETLYYDAAKYRSRMNDLLQTRCAQRDALAFYRLSTIHVRQELVEGYRLATQARIKLRQALSLFPQEIDHDATAFSPGTEFVMLPEKIVFKSGVPEETQADVLRLLTAKQDEIIEELTRNLNKKFKGLQGLVNQEKSKLGERSWPRRFEVGCSQPG